jgi:hypothetical protein
MFHSGTFLWGQWYYNSIIEAIHQKSSKYSIVNLNRLGITFCGGVADYVCTPPANGG